MYLPSQFREERINVLHALVRDYPLGTLVTFGSGGLNANHIPFLIDAEPGPFGTLRGHVARANPVWREFDPAVETLVIFQGPGAYVTPSWYPSKRETGKVVPTFNYMVVHAYGSMRVVDDAVWLCDLVERLTRHFETGRASPWQVEDAPREFIERQLRAIVGIEIPVIRLMGKWKISQNRLPADRAGVMQGLLAEGGPGATEIAGRIAELGL